MSTSLGKAAMSIKLALAAQDDAEEQMELFDQQSSSDPLSKIHLDKMVNGYKTCLPLFSAALKGHSDDPLATLLSLSSTVKLIFRDLCPPFESEVDVELTQRLFSLRAIVINLVAIAYAEDRHEQITKDEIRKYLTETIYDVELFAEPQRNDSTTFNELFISIKGSVFIRAFNYGIDTELCKEYANGIWANITQSFGGNKASLSTIATHLLNPLMTLFDAAFEKEHKVHNLQLAGGHEESLQTEIMANVLRQHKLALAHLFDCINIGE